MVPQATLTAVEGVISVEEVMVIVGGGVLVGGVMLVEGVVGTIIEEGKDLPVVGKTVGVLGVVLVGVG